MMASQRDGATSTQTASTGYTRYVVWLLFVIGVVNFFDRSIINILAEQIKRDLVLADWQVGLLTGFAFAVLYTLCGIPIALFADRSNRARIIVVSLGAWSVFTAMCGMAQNFSHLLMARIAVGLGEAGCQPPSLSLIAEYAPPDMRSRAMGVYALCIPTGGLLALSVGGILSEHLGWRAAFFVAGLPGILLAVLAFFTLRDPRAKVPRAVASRSVGSSFAALRSNPVFWWLSLGSGFMALVGYGQIAFFGSFFLRLHKPGLAAMSASVESATGIVLGPIAIMGVALGLITGLAGLVGAFVGGQLGQRFSAKTPSALMWVPAIAAPVCIPFYLAAFSQPSTPLALLLLFIPKVIGNVWIAPTLAALQGVVPADIRATASAVQSSFVLMIGLGLGPLLVGVTSDLLATAGGLGEAQGLRWALILTTLACVVAMIFFALAARAMRRVTLS